RKSCNQLPAEYSYSNPCSFPFQASCGNFGRCEYSCNPAFIRKRNERERQRVKCVNEGYAKLRHHLPAEYLEKRLSKVETLRAAIKYIKGLRIQIHTFPGKGFSFHFWLWRQSSSLALGEVFFSISKLRSLHCP
uniref:Achaete-scute family bHLH transcription factor 3 n=1 Tax=Anolis carolinensis TaxID=28377 RepID=G1KJE8_ANOCA